MNCDCEKYQDLEFRREAIDRRIKETKRIKKNLYLIDNNQKYCSRLWKCDVCNQYWQSSNAWNWGAKEYIYKVPVISVEEWLSQAFIKPDELLIYSAILHRFENEQIFVERSEKCRKEDCFENAIQFSVFCKTHHIESLQNNRAFPKFPEGKMFEPY